MKESEPQTPLDSAIQQALQFLREHCDTAMVFCTLHEGDKEGTNAFHAGFGNYFSRLAQVQLWVGKELNEMTTPDEEEWFMKATKKDGITTITMNAEELGHLRWIVENRTVNKDDIYRERALFDFLCETHLPSRNEYPEVPAR
jgi:hypothetical protein